MRITEDQNIEMYGKLCMHCMPNLFLPYEQEWSCAACGFNIAKK